MAHELATTNGRTAMMYAGEVPWHKLGTRLNEPATAREAIDAAGLNYLAELKTIQTDDRQSRVADCRGSIAGASIHHVLVLPDQKSNSGESPTNSNSFAGMWSCRRRMK
jgi:hypothetical protein